MFFPVPFTCFFIVFHFQACMNLDFLWGTFLGPISQAPAVLQLSLAIFELCDLQPWTSRLRLSWVSSNVVNRLQLLSIFCPICPGHVFVWNGFSKSWMCPMCLGKVHGSLISLSFFRMVFRTIFSTRWPKTSPIFDSAKTARARRPWIHPMITMTDQ